MREGELDELGNSVGQEEKGGKDPKWDLDLEERVGWVGDDGVEVGNKGVEVILGIIHVLVVVCIGE